MILIDSIYINNSGGKILLDYLVEELEKANIDIFYLFDSRCKGSYDDVPKNRKLYLNASLLHRNSFYKKNKSKFSKVLCFGNLPPLFSTQAEVFTYFHQRLFIEPSTEFPLHQRIIFYLKRLLFNYLKSNTDYWLVQTNSMKRGLLKKHITTNSKIKILPFYPPLKANNSLQREKQTYIYVSGASPHKNHSRLIDAFCLFFDKQRTGKLILTINNDFPEINEIINKKIEQGYPILNHSFVNRNQLAEIYAKSEYLIYPSLSESFGLGIIEAMENDCKVIAADLPYTYDVCEPSLVFDPLSVNSIFEAFEKSLKGNIKPTVQKVRNETNKLVELLRY